LAFAKLLIEDVRFGRIILAGLAPLVGLSAIAAHMLAFAPHSEAAPQVTSADALPRLLQAVLPLFAAAESATAAPLPNPVQHAPLILSLWLLASLAAVDLLERRHIRTLLRC
jgi:hypothetical protein